MDETLEDSSSLEAAAGKEVEDRVMALVKYLKTLSGRAGGRPLLQAVSAMSTSGSILEAHQHRPLDAQVQMDQVDQASWSANLRNHGSGSVGNRPHQELRFRVLPEILSM